MLDDLEGAAVLVAGGTRGIGFAVCEALVELGASVVLTGRKRDAAEAVAATLRARGGNAVGEALDMRELDDLDGFVSKVESKVGPLRACVVSAGTNPYFERIENVTRQQWDEILMVNLRGPFFLAQAVGRRMLERQAGSIVFISSATASKGAMRGLPYVASKGGVNSAVRTMALDWGPGGVRVNAVAPGYIATDMTEGIRRHQGISTALLGKIPLGRFGQPAEIANLVVALCSQLSSYVTGQVLAADGGYLIS